MKKYLITIMAVMAVVGTQTTLAVKESNKNTSVRVDDDKSAAKDSTDNKKKGKREGRRRGNGGPGRGMFVQPTEGCKCNTCEQLRQMEERMKQMREQGGGFPQGGAPQGGFPQGGFPQDGFGGFDN